MKILYFSFVELDIPNACQTHTLGILKGFSKHECEVHAVLPRSINIRPDIPNVRFYYLWPWRFSRIGIFWFKLLSSLFMFLLCMLNKYDAIYARELEANPGPRYCSKVFRIPLYIEINDLIIPVLNENMVRSSLVQKVRKHQELDFKHSSGLIIPSVPMCRWVIDEYGLAENKVHMIVNGSNVNGNRKVSSHEARIKLGLPSDSFCLGFVGNIYERYDFNTILRAIAECRNKIPTLHFVIIGEGPLLSEVKIEIEKLGLKDRTIFTGYIQPEKLGEILPAINIGLLCLTKKDAFRYGPITTKLSTYALHNLAVISAGFSLEGYPDDLAQGIDLVPPEDSYLLADKIIQLYNEPNLRKQKAKILHNFAVEKLTWISVAKETLGIINNNLKP